MLDLRHDFSRAERGSPGLGCGVTKFTTAL